MKNGRIKQSLAYWCLNASDWNWDIHQICETAVRLGCQSIELVPPELWPVVRDYGLKSAIALNGMPMPFFARGFNNPRDREEVIAHTKSTIDQCVEYTIPSVIAFTGYSGGMSLTEGAESCVKGLKELAPYAEAKGVTVCLEQLNTRDDSHPMKGHPGYQGDNMDYCAAIVQQVGSPRVKLLFDIYHVAIMNGDVIRRLRQYRELIGHIHTAGVPGRAELDDRQEINYPAVMRTLLEIGYEGYVGHEFIPTRDPVQGLSEAVNLCDV